MLLKEVFNFLWDPYFEGGQTPQPKTEISFSDKRESYRGATTLPQGILLNFLVKIFFLVGLHLFLSPFFLLIWISSPLPCFMPFSLLCCCCYPFCVSLSSCFGIFFSSDCIPPSLQLPQHLPSTVFIHKGPVSCNFFFKQSYFFVCVLCHQHHLWFYRISLCSYTQTHKNLTYLHKQLFYSGGRKAELTTSVSIKLSGVFGKVLRSKQRYKIVKRFWEKGVNKQFLLPFAYLILCMCESVCEF